MTDLHIPNHIAIIMDGNGRWAEAKGMERSQGHAAGVQAVRTITSAAAKRGVSCLTLYAFSTENWQRPEKEVNRLMALFVESLSLYAEELYQQGVCLKAIGDTAQLPPQAQEKLDSVMARTAANDRMTLVVALSYSGRSEIGRALCRYLQDPKNSLSPADVDPYAYPLEPYLDTAGLPDVDLLIRTGGEQRLSNFLLYQSAYAELYFTDLLWPDFDEKALDEALQEFARRERRYGKV